MQYKLELDVTPLTSLYRGLGQYLAQQEKLLGSVGEVLTQANMQRHERSVDPEGRAWAPLSKSVTEAIVQRHLSKTKRKNPPTQKAIDKAKEAAGRRRILWDTGRMLAKSLHPEVQGDTVVVGFDVNYAKFHHYGTAPYTIRPRAGKALKFNGRLVARVLHPGLPARPLLGFPESDQRAVENDIIDNLQAIVRSIKR